MIQILFFFFAALAAGAAVNVLVQKHVLYSALSLILMLTAMSGLFILLRADFLAVIQIIVYAGAIMVLFVFVIMLLNLPADEDGADRLRWLKFISFSFWLARLYGTSRPEAARRRLLPAVRGRSGRVCLPITFCRLKRPRC